MEREHNGTLGWCCIAGFVIAFDMFSEETLSHAVERGLENKYSRPWVLGALALTGAHLSGMLPEQVDPFKRTLLYFKKS